MAIHNNPVKQREYYSALRQRVNERMPRIRKCEQCGERCDIRFDIEQDSDPIQDESGNWFCSVECLVKP